LDVPATVCVYLTNTDIPNRFPAELCLYIRDGLRMLSSGPVGLYVPDMKWDVAQHYLGRSPMFEHLVTADDSGADAKSDQASPKTFILKVLDLAADDFSPEVPLTTYGLDSLSAARLSFQLRSVVQVTQMQLLAHMTLNDIMAKISVAVEEVAAEQGEAITTGASQSASSTKMLMQTLVDRYSVRFRRREAPGVVASGKVVLITGSTGGLGCGVLVALAATPDVTRIFALNRPSSSNQHSLEERQAKALEQQALSLTKEQREKVTLVECVLHEPKLGLRDDLYQEVCCILRTFMNHH
jgi:aryl carrier-like protein